MRKRREPPQCLAPTRLSVRERCPFSDPGERRCGARKAGPIAYPRRSLCRSSTERSTSPMMSSSHGDMHERSAATRSAARHSTSATSMRCAFSTSNALAPAHRTDDQQRYIEIDRPQVLKRKGAVGIPVGVAGCGAHGRSDRRSPHPTRLDSGKRRGRGHQTARADDLVQRNAQYEQPACQHANARHRTPTRANVVEPSFSLQAASARVLRVCTVLLVCVCLGAWSVPALGVRARARTRPAHR